ncbi:MAG: hypothetical protein EOO81_01135 [Oxalobacteraceae bacterium]|nr:MAG: hypothetical protein EOO81_01135 [Oxalobacteraceae bacterium]
MAVFNSSHRAHHADAALKETLRTMAANLIADACVRIQVIGADIRQDAIAAAPVFRDAIEAALHAIASHVRAQGKTGPS